MVRQIDIPKVTPHFCLFYLPFYLPHNSSVFVYPTSPQPFLSISALIIPLSISVSVYLTYPQPFVYLCLCLSHLPSALCLSLSRQPFVYLTYPQPFVLSHCPQAFICLSSSHHFVFFQFFSILSFLPFPFFYLYHDLLVFCITHTSSAFICLYFS